MTTAVLEPSLVIALLVRYLPDAISNKRTSQVTVVLNETENRPALTRGASLLIMMNKA